MYAFIRYILNYNVQNYVYAESTIDRASYKGKDDYSILTYTDKYTRINRTCYASYPFIY